MKQNRQKILYCLQDVQNSYQRGLDVFRLLDVFGMVYAKNGWHERTTQPLENRFLFVQKELTNSKLATRVF